MDSSNVIATPVVELNRYYVSHRNGRTMRLYTIQTKKDRVQVKEAPERIDANWMPIRNFLKFYKLEE